MYLELVLLSQSVVRLKNEPFSNKSSGSAACPLHGEVTNDQIVSGYEYAHDRYVVVDPDIS